MIELKEKIDKCYQEIQNKYEKIPSVKLKDKLFVIIDKNNIAKTSNLETSLVVDDFKYVLCFPIIEYTPCKNWYYSNIAPIIIDRNMSIVDNIIINNWRLSMIGQHLSFKPISDCRISNYTFEFDINCNYSYNRFNDIWDKFLLFTKMKDINETEILNDFFKSENKEKFLDTLDIERMDYTNKINNISNVLSLLRS